MIPTSCWWPTGCNCSPQKSLFRSCALPFLSIEGALPKLDQDNADTVCQALVKLLKGFPIAIDKLPDIQALAVHADIPPSQPDPGASQAVATSPHKKPEEQHVLTQVALGNPEASDDEPPAKRLKDEPLQVADLRNHKDTLTKMLALDPQAEEPFYAAMVLE